jgi:hypothetical protein
MRAFIRWLWHDSVWSKIISVAIIAAATWVWTHPELWARMQDALGAAAGWLKSPASITHGRVLLYLLLVAVAAILAVRRMRRLRALVAESAPPPVAAAPLPPVALADLDDRQRAFLTFLCTFYPESAKLKTLVNDHVTYSDAERIVESLEKLGLVAVDVDNYSYDKTVVITKPRGRDFCHVNKLDGGF